MDARPAPGSAGHIALADPWAGAQVHKFSKFIHGSATLLPDLVQAVPYWVDDESVRPSMLQSAPAPPSCAPCPFLWRLHGSLDAEYTGHSNAKHSHQHLRPVLKSGTCFVCYVQNFKTGSLIPKSRNSSEYDVVCSQLFLKLAL